jgi:soluble lytic murein transglycosylase-like protein
MEAVLSYFQESGQRPIGKDRLFEPVRCRSLALAVFGLLTVSGLIEASSVTAAPARQGPAELSLTTPLQIEKYVFFRTDYLERAVEEASRAEPADSGAARYAKRYKIGGDLARTIHESATREGIDPDLAFRLIRVESRFDPRARGGSALGLMQLLPGTARTIERAVKSEQLLEPKTNLRIGFKYLRQMIERYDGNVRLGLLAYNRGEVAVDRALRNGRDPENGYSHKVLGSRGTNPYSGKGILPGEKAKQEAAKPAAKSGGTKKKSAQGSKAPPAKTPKKKSTRRA